MGLRVEARRTIAQVAINQIVPDLVNKAKVTGVTSRASEKTLLDNLGMDEFTMKLDSFIACWQMMIE
jgi:hypothetical protein